MKPETIEKYQSEINQLRNLPQYAKKGDSTLVNVIRKRRRDDEFNLENVFTDKKELKLARSLLEKYLREYSIENVSDKNTLIQLIDLEIIHFRLRDELNHFHITSNSVPVKLVDVIHNNLSKIVELKNSLGLIRSKENEQRTDAYNFIQTLFKKAKIWREQNQVSRTLYYPVVCKNCNTMWSEPLLLKMRTDKYDAQKHPYFKDRILYNKTWVRLYKEGKLTKNELAKVFETSEDYIDWVIEKLENRMNTTSEYYRSKALEEADKKNS